MSYHILSPAPWILLSGLRAGDPDPEKPYHPTSQKEASFPLHILSHLIPRRGSVASASSAAGCGCVCVCVHVSVCVYVSERARVCAC